MTNNGETELSEHEIEIKARYAELQKFGKSLDTESDRAVLIVAAAVFEDQLNELLARALVKDTAEELLKDALDSFSKKIMAARALGLISAGMRQSLDIIRKMRNEAAHKPADLKLADASFTARIGVLSTHWEKHVVAMGMGASLNGHPARETFSRLAAIIWLGLKQSVEAAKELPAQDMGTWPALAGWK